MTAPTADERAELEALRAWKREAMPLFDGLQDLGRALDVPLGVLVTGPVAVEAARNLRAKVAAVEALAEGWRARSKHLTKYAQTATAVMSIESAIADLRAALGADASGGGEGEG